MYVTVNVLFRVIINCLREDANEFIYSYPSCAPDLCKSLLNNLTKLRRVMFVSQNKISQSNDSTVSEEDKETNLSLEIAPKMQNLIRHVFYLR